MTPTTAATTTATTQTLAYGRFEGVRLLRSSGFIGPAIIIPTVMYLVFTRLGDNAGQAAVAQYLMVSMACFGAVGAALSNGLGAIEERESGWLQQLRTTPIPPLGVVVVRAALGVVAAVPPVVAVLAAGAVVNHVRLTPGHWVACFAALVVGVIPFALLGLAIGYGVRTQLAQQLSMLLNLGLALVGGLWIPAGDFPPALRAVSGWSPTGAFGEIGRAAAGIQGLDALGLARLAAWTLALLVVAVAVCTRAVRQR